MILPFDTNMPFDPDVSLDNLTAIFPDPLILRVLPGGNRMVVNPFQCLCEALGIEFTVTPGFIFDLASIPSFLTPVLPKIGNHDKAATGHDFLYRFQIYNRKMADMFFWYGMIDQDVGMWQRNIMYQGVRAGAWKAWNNNTKRLKEGRI